MWPRPAIVGPGPDVAAASEQGLVHLAWAPGVGASLRRVVGSADVAVMGGKRDSG